MNEENIKILKEIKEQLSPGNSAISGDLWKKYYPALIEAGTKIIEDIGKMRETIYPIKIHLIYLKDKEKMEDLDNSYNELCAQYGLFFDATMRLSNMVFTEGISGGKHLQYLLDHSSQAMDHITTLVSKKSTEYKHCQTLFVALAAIVIAVISLLGLRVIGYAILGLVIFFFAVLAWNQIRNNGGNTNDK
jgi:hypothetical protein